MKTRHADEKSRFRVIIRQDAFFAQDDSLAAHPDGYISRMENAGIMVYILYVYKFFQGFAAETGLNGNFYALLQAGGAQRH
ncbi:MAG: hypothetical protein LBU26_01265 [Synergistaceae bacterium]|jgi:hypothetical protein|nr:hypothetical protein [Synergistaceae bacterium]